MSPDVSRFLVRANASYIAVAAFAGLIFDIRGVLFGLGPQGRLLAAAPYAGIGFVEAHGLALILAIVLWRAVPGLAAHLTAMAMALLLGTANIAFWEMFVATDALAVGYVSTSLHWTFVAAQLFAAIAVVRRQRQAPIRGGLISVRRRLPAR